MKLAGFAAVRGTVPAPSCGQVRDNNPDSEAKEREQLREQLLLRRKVGLSLIGIAGYEPATARVISRLAANGPTRAEIAQKRDMCIRVQTH
jgi:hypothetical protein